MAMRGAGRIDQVVHHREMVVARQALAHRHRVGAPALADQLVLADEFRANLVFAPDPKWLYTIYY